MFIQHADTTHAPHENTAKILYNTFMQHIVIARKIQEDAHIKRDLFFFQLKN